MFCSKSNNYKIMDKLLKMSLVPVACQESQLKADGSTQSENIEWLLDLKDKTPIWSLLLDINTSGFKRKLPLSMTESYDIEVEGRLWSLWGSKRKCRKQHKRSKSYMAITMMALCAARALSLNAWNTKLMDIIKTNGRLYFKESIKKANCSCKDFQLKHLLTECNLEGIQFNLHLKTVQKGLLYSPTQKCETNLAFALINFFNCYQFGILECRNRILGVGFIDGPQGGYFMYDAQSFSQPIFPQDTSAPYVLRTNHLQILLYSLVVALNVCSMQAGFCLHHVEIAIKDAYEIKPLCKQLDHSIATCPHFIPSELWQTPENLSLKSASSTNNSNQKQLNNSLSGNSENELRLASSFQKKYQRKIHNIKKDEVAKSLIKPLVDADREEHEEMSLKKDFVRMVCSDTKLPLTTADLPQKNMKEFAYDITDALLMGPELCLKLKNL